MEDEKVIIKLIMGASGSDSESSGTPASAVFDLTQPAWDRIKRLSEVAAKEEGAEGCIDIKVPMGCEWFALRPPYTFEELGDKFMVNVEDYGFDELGGTTDCYSDENTDNSERVEGQNIVISKHGFYFESYGKYSGTVYTSYSIGLKALEDELEKSGQTPRWEYYYQNSVDVPALEDLPLNLDDSNACVRLYAAETLKQGD